jgi:hypothetical protein
VKSKISYSSGGSTTKNFFSRKMIFNPLSLEVFSSLGTSIVATGIPLFTKRAQVLMVKALSYSKFKTETNRFLVGIDTTLAMAMSWSVTVKYFL